MNPAQNSLAPRPGDALIVVDVQNDFLPGGAEYCVLGTVKDANSLGFETVLLCDAVRAVNSRPGDRGLGHRGDEARAQ